MARPTLPRDKDGSIIRDTDSVTPENVEEVVVNMTPEWIRALVESVAQGMLTANASSQSMTADAITALIKEQGRTMLKSNAQDPGISAYSYPEGEVARPKPKLNMATWFSNARVHNDTLTPAEVQLYNELNEDRACRDGKWTVKIDRSNVSAPRRIVMVPCFTIGERAELPESLTLILMELATGKESISRESLAAEVLRLRERVDALSAAAA